MMMASKVCLVSFEYKRRLRWKTFGNAWRKNGNGTPGHMEILTLEMHGSKFLRKLAVFKGFGCEVLVWFGEDGWKCPKKMTIGSCCTFAVGGFIVGFGSIDVGIQSQEWLWLATSCCRFVGLLERELLQSSPKSSCLFWNVYIYYLLWPLIFYTYDFVWATKNHLTNRGVRESTCT